MKAGKKIIISMVALILVVSLGIIAVFALTQTSVNASLKVYFVATRNVYSKITGEVLQKTASGTTYLDGDEITINNTTQSTSNNLEFSSYPELHNNSEQAIFVFTITNTNHVNAYTNLIIEPVANNIPDNSIAVFAFEYQYDKAQEYQSAKEHQYYELINDNVSLDATIKFKLTLTLFEQEDSTFSIENFSLSFNLYSIDAAPEGYTDSCVTVTSNQTNLALAVGDKVSYGLYPTTYVGDTINAQLIAAFDNHTFETPGPDSYNNGPLLQGDVGYYDLDNDGTKEPYFYYAMEGATSNADLKFYYMQAISFTVKEIRDGKAILLSDKIISTSEHVFTQLDKHYPDFVKPTKRNMTVSEANSWFTTDAERIATYTDFANAKYSSGDNLNPSVYHVDQTEDPEATVCVMANGILENTGLGNPGYRVVLETSVIPPESFIALD